MHGERSGGTCRRQAWQAYAPNVSSSVRQPAQPLWPLPERRPPPPSRSRDGRDERRLHLLQVEPVAVRELRREPAALVDLQAEHALLLQLKERDARRRGPLDGAPGRPRRPIEPRLLVRGVNRLRFVVELEENPMRTAHPVRTRMIHPLRVS